jgi:membrane-bound serine protease (ClpP class)
MAPGTSMGAAAPVFQTPEGMEMAPEKVVSPLRAQMASLAEKNGYPKSVAVAMVDADVELFEAHQGTTLRVVTSDEFAELERLARREGSIVEKGRLLSAKGKLLTLTAGEAERYGVSSGTVDSLDQVLGRLGAAGVAVVRVEPTAPDEVVALITSTAATTLLIMAGLVALFVEITTPGFGVPGTIAILCFAIVFASNALLGNVGSLEVLLFVAGIALLVVEIFVLPGFGVVGVSGITLMVAALVLSRQDFVLPTFDFQWDVLRRNLLVVLVALGGGLAGFAVAARFLPGIGPFRSLVLSTSQTQGQGFTVQAPQEAAGLVGMQGTASSPLRPVGKAAFGDSVMVVTSEGEFIEAGTKVQIVEASANRVVVRKV